MSAESDAYAAAEARIEAASKEGGEHLDLAYSDCAALTRLPDSLATLPNLKSLTLGDGTAHVAITDLSPLTSLTDLSTLFLNIAPF